jgi:hypothetical protein
MMTTVNFKLDPHLHDGRKDGSTTWKQPELKPDPLNKGTWVRLGNQNYERQTPEHVAQNNGQ